MHGLTPYLYMLLSEEQALFRRWMIFIISQLILFKICFTHKGGIYISITKERLELNIHWTSSYVHPRFMWIRSPHPIAPKIIHLCKYILTPVSCFMLSLCENTEKDKTGQNCVLSFFCQINLGIDHWTKIDFLCGSE